MPFTTKTAEHIYSNGIIFKTISPTILIKKKEEKREKKNSPTKHIQHHFLSNVIAVALTLKPVSVCLQ